MVATTFKESTGDLDHMFKLHCALEAYGELLGGEEVDIDSSLGRSIQLGMESIDPSIDLKEGSYITLRMIKEGVIKVAKATREAIRVLLEIVGNLYVKFTGSLGRVRGHQKAVSKRIGRLGNRVSYKQMEISGINRLSVNGSFVGDSVEVLGAIRNISEHLLNKHPATVVKVARVCSRRFVDLVESNQGSSKKELAQAGMQTFIDTLQAAVVPVAGQQPVKAGELPGSFTSGRYLRSEVMPGNWALVYTNLAEAVRGGAQSPDMYANVIKQAFRIEFVELSLNTADRAPRTMDVPSIRTLTQLVDGISKILDVAEKAEAGRRDFATVKTVVDDAIRQVMDVPEGSDGAANTTVIQMLGSMSEVLAAPMDSFTHWVAVTLNIYLNFIDHCIKHYEVDGV